jgi:single-strand DNA-binding protein
MDLNRAMIIGNVTRDPELRTTSSGQTVASFGVATNHAWKDASGNKQEKAEFHNIVAWGKLAEICGQYLTKGRKIYIEGRIQTREWEGQDGQRRQRTEIVAENMIMLERAGAGGTQPNHARAEGQPVRASEPQAVGQPTPPSPQGTGGQAVQQAQSGDDEIRIEDIPF